LLALPFDELNQPDVSGDQLAKEAREILGGPAGIAGPMIPLPRVLLPWVLSRDVLRDSHEPDSAVQQIAQSDPEIAELYGLFLQDVRDSEHIRQLNRSLRDLWDADPTSLGDFLIAHPELATPEAVAEVRAELAALPIALRNEAPPLGRLRLVEGLAAGRDPAELASEYLDVIGSFFIAEVAPEYDQLTTLLRNDPSPDRIPESRRALEIAEALDPDQERLLSYDLAARLLQQTSPDAREGIDEAVRLLERSRRLGLTHDSLWAAATGMLALALDRQGGADPLETWERECRLLEEACAASDRETDPDTWALNHSNFGYLLTKRPGGSTSDDMSRALAELTFVLEVRSPQNNPVDWAYTKLAQGIAYRTRGQSGDTERAIDCHRSALQHFDVQEDRLLWVAHQYNLALVLLDKDPPDFDQAGEAIRVGLAGSTDPLFTGLLTSLRARVTAVREGPLSERVIALRQKAAQLIDPRLEPALHLESADKLVDALQQLDRWEEAAEQYERSWAAFETLYDIQLSTEGRQEVLTRYARLSRWAAFALARAGHASRAVEVIERGRAMELSVATSRETADLARLMLVDRQLVDRYYDTYAKYRVAIGARFGASSPGLASEQTQDMARAVERSLRNVIAEIQSVPGFETFLKPMTIGEIGVAADGHPAIYLITAPRGSYCITVNATDGDVDVNAVYIEAITGRLISDLVIANLETGRPGLLAAQQPMAASDLLGQVLEDLTQLQPLSMVIASEIERLQKQAAIIVPTGLLGFIPFSALPANSSTGAVLDDVCELRLAPSLAIYRACCYRATIPRQSHLVGIADTDPANELSGSRAELESIELLFSRIGATTVLAGEKATLSWLLSHAPKASHLHLACHGYSSLSDTWGGALFLGEQTRLTVRDLVQGERLSARLVVASACQSGHFAVGETPDEFVGLAAGCLEAGAACAIVSLWPVADDGTALLMTRFYEYLLQDGLDPPDALRRSRHWLRHLTNEARGTYLRDRPLLAEALRRQGITSPSRGTGHVVTRPYEAPEHWAAFVAYGC
jgi:CHAT domain-containing protein